MQKANRLTLIGIGYRPLGTRAKEVLAAADVILASSRLAEVFQRYEEYGQVMDRIRVINKVDETIAFIGTALRTPDTVIRGQAPNSEPRTIVLLASGDPLFFGIGRRMALEFGRENVEILPDLSSMQVAFARINMPWDDAFCISVHGGPDIAKRRTLPYEMKDIPALLDQHDKIAVLTDKVNSPAEIARVISSEQRTPDSQLVMHVCERLGYSDERVWTGSVDAAVGVRFREPNVVIIQRQGAGARGKGGAGFGLKEDELAHRDGMITKDEVRAVSIHKLRLPAKGVLWDIGAGSGSVAIEAARLAPGLRVIAVERDAEQVTRIRTNKIKFAVRNLEVLQGAAPDALAEIDPPDRVFIGGSGGNLEAIVDLASRRMQAGTMVINAATLDTLQAGIAALERCGFDVDVSEVSVSRSKIVAGKKLMAAMNPVFIVKGERG